ncbi:MAG: hypothetical protein NUV77_23720 [Thermoguttaceae bacterium]|jgi:hypothetical protein|nr:hypothetical protein [Thermoguttaceae bacterium]
MNSLHRVARALVATVVCLGILGCGTQEKRVIVTGKVSEGGKPLDLSGKEYKVHAKAVEVTFYPVDSAGKVLQNKPTYGATVQADGSFKIEGENGTGLPVGKYKVGVVHRDPMYRTPKGQGDRFDQRFSLEKTPFVFDIQESKSIELDVSAGGGAAPNP